MKYSIILMVVSFSLLTSCGGEKKNEKSMEEKNFSKGEFGYDLNFLQNKDENLIVLKQDSSQVLVSPKYQAKVFTSTAAGKKGRSYGWINYEAFGGKIDEHMNAYGGENRFWLGPEGSKFSLFFKPGTKMVFDNWKTPAPVDTESWNVIDKGSDEVTLEKEMSLLNYAGTQLEIKAERRIEILDEQEIENLLEVQFEGVHSVGYTTKNTITNIGHSAWTKETGAPSIWILDMFKPSDSTVIVIPYRENAPGKVATTDYFGEIPDDRINYSDGTLFFKADGKSRGKLGLSPKRATPVAGSYDPKNNILTITRFDINRDATYLNQEWNLEKDPYKGDVVNAYNDGPLEDGSQMGPFYEIESVSPAAFLKPKEELTHFHSVFHFTGDETQLNEISKKVLGVSLEEIKSAF